MVSTSPESEMTTPLPVRSEPSVCAVNPSSGIWACNETIDRSASDRSKPTSSGRGCCADGISQRVFSLMTFPPHFSRAALKLAPTGYLQTSPQARQGARGAMRTRFAGVRVEPQHDWAVGGATVRIGQRSPRDRLGVRTFCRSALRERPGWHGEVALQSVIGRIMIGPALILYILGTFWTTGYG